MKLFNDYSLWDAANRLGVFDTHYHEITGLSMGKEKLNFKLEDLAWEGAKKVPWHNSWKLTPGSILELSLNERGQGYVGTMRVDGRPISHLQTLVDLLRRRAGQQPHR